MEDRRRIVIAISVALVILLALGYSFGMNFFSHSYVLDLPDPDAVSSGAPEASPTGSVGGITVEVTPQTVQNAIATLFRYESYSRTVSVTYYWGEDGQETVTSELWVDGGWSRTDSRLPDGLAEHSITGEGQIWLWYADNELWHGDAEDDMADRMQHLPTYEDLLQIPREQIVAADYVLYEGEPCIYVESSEPELGYRCRWWISVTNGLLIAARTEKDAKTVYEMTSGEVRSPLTAERQVFTLPDGTRLHSVG